MGGVKVGELGIEGERKWEFGVRGDYKEVRG
jgi:hypothetical protein